MKKKFFSGLTVWMMSFGIFPSLGLAADIVINEFLANPTGSDIGYEWIELTNTGTVGIDLANWSIERATSSFSTAFTFPSIILPPSEYLVIGEEFVAEADFIATLNLGNATTSGDALRLVDNLGSVVDTVIYGPNNTDGFLDDSGLVATSLAPTPISGSSLARISDGNDTNESGNDFLLVSVPTIGASNLNENQNPIADAGLDQIVLGAASLDGSNSYDIDGTIISWDWTLQHRTNPANNKTATGSNPQINGLTPGFYDVTLIVGDNAGGTSADIMLLGVGIYDINGDGKLGLAEAINALQVTSGMRSQICSPSIEICDGLDNDCNGLTDENDVCGNCTFSSEICDGCDNDCDGIIDNPPVGGFPGGCNPPVDTGQPGSCI